MKINRSDLINFAQVGVGTSLFQLSAPASWDLGFSPNQWQEAGFLNEAKVPKTQNYLSAWVTLKKYLPILARMGFKRLRFSVEWNYIEPQQGHYNLEAINQYRELIYACIQYGIEPMLTLYHFTQPAWFKDNGGFENPKNIPCFVNYCRYVLTQLGSIVNYWCTFNEPAIEAFLGYFLGLFPPHQHIHLSKSAMVLKHMLEAHIGVCELILKLSPQSHFGLVHNFLQFESRSTVVSSLVAKPLSHFTNDLILEFMHSGHFQYGKIGFQHSGCRGNSFFINIYGNVQLGFLGPTCQPDQKMGDMHLALYPESYAQALKVCSEIKLPIFITETGFADDHDETRPEFILAFISVVIENLRAGLDIRGLYYWTFKDNYEWYQGNMKQFGLFDLDDKPKNSAYLLTWVLHNMQKIAHEFYAPEEILAEWSKMLALAKQKVQEQDFLFFRNFANQVGLNHK